MTLTSGLAYKHTPSLQMSIGETLYFWRNTLMTYILKEISSFSEAIGGSAALRAEFYKRGLSTDKCVQPVVKPQPTSPVQLCPRAEGEP